MKQIQRSISIFAEIISDNYLYVDKTKYIRNLVKEDKYLFLSRPRRFGKTLLVSTLKELFLGNRELFKGLWIDSSDYAWKPHPVIHIDFSKRLYRTSKVFEQDLIKHLIRIGKQHDIELDYDDGLQTTLSILVEELSKKERVVVLIDEYDHPLLRHLPHKKDEEGTAQSKTAYMNREILSDFFTTLKGLDEHLRFVFATGVTKFAKTSIFSGGNNFNDISWDAEYAALLGYTSQEVDTFLKPHLDNYANHRGISADDAKKEITSWYNGYRFSPEETKVFNPFSLHYCLSKKIRENYWAESGTPSFLVRLMKQGYKELPEKALAAGDMQRFCQTLQTMLAGIPYTLHERKESYYHSLFHVLAYVLNYDVHSEVMTDKGRKIVFMSLNSSSKERLKRHSSRLIPSVTHRSLNVRASRYYVLAFHSTSKARSLPLTG